MGKAQAAVELTILLSALMIVLFLIFEFAQTKLIENSSMLQVSQARNTVDRLAEAVANVHNEGVGARRLIFIQIPDRVNSSRIVISNTTITIGLYIANGTSDISAPTVCPVVQGGYFPTTPGSYWVWVISKQGYVQLGSSFSVTPMSVYAELFPTNSSSTNITVTSLSNSTVNVTANLTWSDTEINATINGTNNMSFLLLSGTANSKLINLTVAANNNASFGLHSGYLSITTNLSESEVVPVVVNVVSRPAGQSSVYYLTIDTYNDSGYTNSSTSFLAVGPTNVTYYRVKSYNSTDALVNSTVTIRVYNTTPTLMSEQTYSANSPPNNGTYIGNYTIPFSPPSGWLTGWSYRKQHNMTNSTGADVNYTINITVINGAGTDSGNTVYINNKARSDFGDVRFTNSTGSLLNYWIETLNSGANATFWVQIAGNLTSTNQTIYIYYGNNTATSVSNGTNTFVIFDDFNNGNTQWTKVDPNSHIAFASNELTWTNLDRNEAAYVEKPQSGVDYEAKWTFDISSAQSNNVLEFIAFSSNLGAENLWTNSTSFDYEGTTANYLRKIVSGVSSFSSNLGGITTGTTYYAKLVRSGGTTTMTLYSDAARTVQVWTGSLDTSNVANSNLNYFYILSALNDGTNGNRASSGWLDDLRVRKYVTSEPSHGAWGNEESEIAWLGTWKLTAYDIGGANTAMYFTVS
jgi:hypothetical protein